jgi:hypothetical protein
MSAASGSLPFAAHGVIQSVDIEIVCKPSSFKHGASEADIRHAYQTRVYEAALAVKAMPTVRARLRDSMSPPA